MQWARKKERERKKRERDRETEEEKKKGKKRKEKLCLVLRSCSAPACSDSRAVDIMTLGIFIQQTLAHIL